MRKFLISSRLATTTAARSKPVGESPPLPRNAHNLNYIFNPQTIPPLEKPDHTINPTTHSRSATIFQSAQMRNVKSLRVGVKTAASPLGFYFM
ncbi:hypothetical protein BGX38DRAFT_1281937 [Terfezia claveryi]|nr:hypothetical protein BGX38DRAFT_1281937 [Terfezia claveryi]